MKVTVLGVRGIPGVQGGVETHAEQLYEKLAQLGCEVEVIVRSPFVPAGLKRAGAVHLRRLWSPTHPGFEALIHSLLGVLYAAISRPDILHIHAVGPSIVTPLARLFGLRVVMTHHGPDYDRAKWGRFARVVLQSGERMGVRYSHARIAISKVIANLIRAKYSRDSDLIPNGVAVAPICLDDEYLAQFGLERGKYFLQVSRLVPEKRQLDLIQAFARAKPVGWKLVLVGRLDNDAYSQAVQKAARDAGVVLTGFQNGAPLQQIYSHAGAFVLPSSHEGLPIAMLEALSYGLPVIASDIPANLEIGLSSDSYFPLGEIEALASRIDALAASGDDPIKKAERVQSVKNSYDWDRIASATLDVYRRVMANGTPLGRS